MVSISMTTPKVTSSACAPAESGGSWMASSMATVTSMRRANAASRWIFPASITWLAMSTLLTPPPWAKASASDAFAQQTPPTVAPAAICMARISGHLWFLPCGRRRMRLPR